MKKIILGFAAMSLVLSCKKPPAGGNKAVIKLNDTERYDTHETRGGQSHGNGASHTSTDHGTTEREKVDMEIEGITIHANANGLESRMINFLNSGAYEKAANDDVLKNNWINFDNVNFKMGSSNQLEEGSREQLDNLSKILKAHPEAKIKIGGYTDKTGDEAVNKKISTERANFIKSELSKMGVGAQVISAEGYGSEFATVAADASDAERAVDRKMAVRFAK